MNKNTAREKKELTPEEADFVKSVAAHLNTMPPDERLDELLQMVFAVQWVGENAETLTNHLLKLFLKIAEDMEKPFEFDKVKHELQPETEPIVQQMLAKLKATPFDGRTKALLQMLDDTALMGGRRAEIESFFKRHFYWNQ